MDIFLRVPAHPGRLTPLSHPGGDSSNFSPAWPTAHDSYGLPAATRLGHAGLDGGRSLAIKFLQFLHLRVPWGLRVGGGGCPRSLHRN